MGYVTIEIILASRRHQLREAREASLLVNSALEVTGPDAGNASVLDGVGCEGGQ